MITYPLNAKLDYLMEQIRFLSGLERFILYGGAPIDHFVNSDSNTNDLDIAVEGKNEAKYAKLRKTLRGNGFDILEPRREYMIHGDQVVILIYARNQDYYFDIAFMDRVQDVGLFNIESLYCRFPERDYVDEFGAIEGVISKRISPIRDLDSENPYLLVSRFVYLSAKYDVSWNDSAHDSLIEDLRQRVPNFSFDDISSQYVSCLSSMLKSVIKAKNRAGFILQLTESGLLEIVFPELYKGLLETDVDLIERAPTKGELCRIINENIHDEDKLTFRRKLELLKLRNWDRQDSSLTSTD